MNNKTFDKYFITYSNYFEFNGVKLAFNKEKSIIEYINIE
jgi:hypothetical protein